MPDNAYAAQAGSNPQDLTAIILTFNEELHIARCLESAFKIARRVCVVDSGSTDSTVEIARSSGADVYTNTWVNYATQFQWAVDNCNIDTDWILRIDADEYLSEELSFELTRALQATPHGINGFYVRRLIVFMGRPIRHGFFYPMYMLRVWRTGTATIEQRWMDEHIVLETGDSLRIRKDLIDENLNDLNWWISKHNSYAKREMIDALQFALHISERDPRSSQISANTIKKIIKHKVYYKIPSAIRSSLYFLYRFLLGLGFLDGKPGFYFHFLQGFWYRVVVDAKIDEFLLHCGKAGIHPKEGLANLISDMKTPR